MTNLRPGIPTGSKSIRNASAQKLVAWYRQLFFDISRYKFLNEGREPTILASMARRIKAEIDRRNIIIHHPENNDE